MVVCFATVMPVDHKQLNICYISLYINLFINKLNKFLCLRPNVRSSSRISHHFHRVYVRRTDKRTSFALNFLLNVEKLVFSVGRMIFASSRVGQTGASSIYFYIKRHLGILQMHTYTHTQRAVSFNEFPLPNAC